MSELSLYGQREQIHNRMLNINNELKEMYKKLDQIEYEISEYIGFAYDYGQDNTHYFKLINDRAEIENDIVNLEDTLEQLQEELEEIEQDIKYSKEFQYIIIN